MMNIVYVQVIIFFSQAFEEFVATFQETPSKTTSKVWVKAGTYDAGKRREYKIIYVYSFWKHQILLYNLQ